MNCRQVQRHLHQGTADELPSPQAERLRRHLAECSDCHVARQRALRLQQLLSIKRHETPGANYFDNFLGQFHQRLARATTSPAPLWQRMWERWHDGDALGLRHRLVPALGAVFLVALLWRAIGANEQPANPETAAPPALTHADVAAVAVPPSRSTPQTTASALPSRPLETPPPIHELLPVAARPDFSAPRYVLDRIQATPVSYEVASIHF